MKYLLFFLFLPFYSQGDVGFEVGNEITRQYASGWVQIICRSNMFPRSRYERCRANFFTPDAFSRFQTSETVDADRVILTANHPDGSTETKKTDFDAENGISKKSFNLAINTLFQDPLLEEGENLIEYLLTKNGEEVLRGEFTAALTQGPDLYCSDVTVYENFDCDNVSRACDEFFRRTTCED